jgi:hypothetical protein
MMADVIVGASVALTLGFAAAWVVSSRLRARIEQPKFRFQQALSDYDRAEGGPRAGA